MNNELHYEVSEPDNGRPLRSVLRGRLHVSRGLLRRLARNGVAEVNGVVCRLSDPVFTGDKVRLVFGLQTGGVVPEPIQLDMSYVDEDILVVNKPAGMVVHPARRHKSGTLANAVAYYLEPGQPSVTVRPVHRLDAGTSGLIVFARHAHAHYVLSRDMESGSFRRWYIAVVDGFVEAQPGIWHEVCAPIAKVPEHPVMRRVALEGQAAVTRYKVLHASHERTLLELELLTGRTHQIRVHMAHLGHPLTGDTLYGGSQTLPRPALHSARIEMRQPLTRVELSLSAALPDDLLALVSDMQR